MALGEALGNLIPTQTAVEVFSLRPPFAKYAKERGTLKIFLGGKGGPAARARVIAFLVLRQRALWPWR